MLLQEKMIAAILFLLCLSTTFPVSNAAISISGVLLVVGSLYYVYKDKESGLKDVPLFLLLGILLFCGGIFVATLVIGDSESFKLCRQNILWFVYFFGSYMLARKCNYSFISVVALMFAILGLALPAIDSFILTGKRAHGVLTNSNHLAFAFDLTLPYCTVFCIKIWKSTKKLWIKILSLIVIVIGFGGLYATGSRGGMLGVILALLLVWSFIKLRTKGIALAVVVLLLTGLIAYVGPAIFKGAVVSRRYDNERVLLLKSSYDMWKDHKLAGVGLANWGTEYRNKYILPEARQPKLPNSHNIYMHYLSTTGLVGGLSFVALILAILVVLGKNIGVAGGYYTYAMLGVLLAFSIHGFFDLMTNWWFMKAFCALLGIAMAEIVKDKNKVALKTRE